GGSTHGAINKRKGYDGPTHAELGRARSHRPTPSAGRFGDRGPDYHIVGGDADMGRRAGFDRGGRPVAWTSGYAGRRPTRVRHDCERQRSLGLLRQVRAWTDDAAS